MEATEEVLTLIKLPVICAVNFLIVIINIIVSNMDPISWGLFFLQFPLTLFFKVNIYN